MKFQSSELLNEKYELGSVIGQGSFSIVRGAISKSSSEKPVAIKIISKEKAPSLDSIYFEIETMLKLKENENIIPVLDLFEDEKEIFLVMELAHSELIEWLGKQSNELIARDVVRQLLKCLSYLHERRFVHCDLKPENVLVSLDFNQTHHIYLSDFGLVQQLEEGESSSLSKRYGSPSNFAPEIVNKQPYNEKYDIWSLGVLTYELLTGVHPFLNSPEVVEESELNKRILSKQYTWDGGVQVSKLAQSFVDSLICLDPNERPSAKKALEHPWFSATKEEITIVVEKKEVSKEEKEETEGEAKKEEGVVGEEKRPKTKKQGNAFTRSLRKGLLKLGIIHDEQNGSGGVVVQSNSSEKK